MAAVPKTIKQIADELGVSKQAIRKEIARQGLQVTGNQNQVTGNLVMIEEEAETRIKQAFSKRRNRKPKYEVTGNQKQVTGNQLPPNDQRTEVTMEMLEVVREQLRVQDRQLREQADQIRQLNERLAETTAALVSAQQTIQAVQQTAQAAQALHAGTIQQQLAGQAAPEPVTDQEPPTFWQRIFGKR